MSASRQMAPLPNVGTEMVIICKNVPAEIRQEDHDAGMQSTLANLAKLLSGEGAPHHRAA